MKSKAPAWVHRLDYLSFTAIFVFFLYVGWAWNIPFVSWFIQQFFITGLMIMLSVGSLAFIVWLARTQMLYFFESKKWFVMSMLVRLYNFLE